MSPKSFAQADTFMDIHNNAIGIEISKQNQNATPEELSKIVMKKVQNGEMFMLKPKFNESGGFEG
jgi:hypothetical protein